MLHQLANNFFSNKNEKLFLTIVCCAWWYIWSMLYITVLQDTGVKPLQAVVDGLISNTILALCCVLIINNMRYYLPKQEKYWYVLVITTALSGLWLLLARLCLWSIFKKDASYIDSLWNTTTVRFAYSFLMLSSITMLSLLWYSQREEKEEANRRADTERLAKDAELNKLRQQLQPHFLFNSLNSISALTGTQPEKARHMIQQLSEFLRGTLKNEEQQWTSFEEELKHVQLYLDIEKVRFGHRLQTSVKVEDSVLQMRIPAMLLQPLVENAIKFGLYDTLGEVNIIIEGKKSNDLLEITIENPFDEETATNMKGTGFGIASTRRRLYLLFARHDLLQVKQHDKKYTTIITVPQLIKNESNNN
jgi:two-component system, LytTR family, sensor kinase